MEPFSVGIHPLVVASTCDHYTRVSSGGSKLSMDAPVYGLLFGTKDNVRVSICDCADLVYNVINGKVEIIAGEIENKIKLYTAVFTTYSLLGWYGFGIETTADHVEFHTMLADYSEGPIFLLINPDPGADPDTLPISTFKAELQDNNSQIFVEVPFDVETHEIEKVALDHVTKTTTIPGFSKQELQNQTVATSLKILNDKIECLIDTLCGMQNGSIPVDHKLLRRVAKICKSLPPVHSDQLERDFSVDAVNTMLVSYLGAASCTSSQLSNVADLFSSIYDEHGTAFHK